jgi:hypothetical protein
MLFSYVVTRICASSDHLRIICASPILFLAFLARMKIAATNQLAGMRIDPAERTPSLVHSHRPQYISPNIPEKKRWHQREHMKVNWICEANAQAPATEHAGCPGVAWLVGATSNSHTDDWSVLSCIFHDKFSTDGKDDWDRVLQMIPVGLSCVGLLIPASEERLAGAEAKSLVELVCFGAGNDVTSVLGAHYLVVVWARESDKVVFKVTTATRSIEPVSFNTPEGTDAARHSHVWVRATYTDKILLPIPPVSPYSTANDILSKTIAAEVESSLSYVRPDNLVGVLPDGRLERLGALNSAITIESVLAGKLSGWTLDRCTGPSGNSKSKGKGKGGKGGGKNRKKAPDKNAHFEGVTIADSRRIATTSLNCGDVVTIPIRKDSSIGSVAPRANLWGSIPSNTLFYSAVLNADIMAYAPCRESVSLLMSALVPAIKDQLALLGGILTDRVTAGDMENLKLSPQQFCPSGLAHPLTLHYATMSDESSRRALHDRLALHVGAQRPLFKLACAASFAVDGANTLVGDDPDAEKLVNVHMGLANPTEASGAVAGGTCFLTVGDYRYFHYMQNRYDDKGWGCAYRSLQTIVSWFRMNHFTTILVPSHREIQETLVEAGERKRSFVGSKDWIGSQEVGRYLEHRLGVSFKIIFVRTGDELSDIARTVAMHFKTQGTPIMIGGNNLAFTILGVAWNERTGAVQYLILDPHYCGEDDVDPIQNRVVMLEGYKATPCGWRDVSSFSSRDFYSLCCPQVEGPEFSPL